ncbi:MAG: ABC transporter ATP-binding protein [Candidatus Thermoplasmatota archaeon]
MHAINVENLSKNYGKNFALKELNFSVDINERFGCIGPNAAGKTTLLKILTGQTKPSSGIANVLGIDVERNPIEVKKRVGIVPEVDCLPSFLTPYEYLYFVSKVRGVKDFEKKIEHWLKFFELTGFEATICKDLSKGTRQRLTLASAFFFEPELLFLDEPLSNLDPIYQAKIYEYLKKYRGTIFICSHILGLAEKLCDRVLILSEGRCFGIVKIEELKKESKSLEEFFLGLV